MAENELVEVESPAPACLPDVTNDVHLIARSPAEMKVAQSALVVWCTNKIAIMQKDAAELAENLAIAKANNWKTATLAKHHNLALKQVEFYEKVKAASEAGFCIIPNIPCDVFAVRTKRERPKDRNSSTNQAFAAQPIESEGPPLGAGENVSSVPVVRANNHYDNQGHYVDTTYFARALDDEIAFPIAVAKPEIMGAAAEALALKAFDEIGVVTGPPIGAPKPGRPLKGDPLLVGRIIDPRKTPGTTGNHRRMVTFLIAWYLDTSQL